MRGGFIDSIIERLRALGLGRESLLEYELGSGWGPWCGFLLGNEVPDVEFPHLNESQEFGEGVLGDGSKGYVEFGVESGVGAWGGGGGAGCGILGEEVRY